MGLATRAEEWAVLVGYGNILSIEQCFFDECAVGPRIIWWPRQDDLTVQPLRFLNSYWTGSLDGGQLPSFKIVDPLAMRAALGFIALAEPNADASDFRYRLFGTIITAVSGFDMTGKFLSAHPAPAFIVDFYLATYRAVMQRRAPVATVHRAPVMRATTIWHRLVLPVVDAEGRINRLLIGIVPVATDGAVIMSAGRVPWPQPP